MVAEWMDHFERMCKAYGVGRIIKRWNNEESRPW
jgi:hypothetical protein